MRNKNKANCIHQSKGIYPQIWNPGEKTETLVAEYREDPQEIVGQGPRMVPESRRRHLETDLEAVESKFCFSLHLGIGVQANAMRRETFSKPQIKLKSLFDFSVFNRQKGKVQTSHFWGQRLRKHF